MIISLYFAALTYYSDTPPLTTDRQIRRFRRCKGRGPHRIFPGAPTPEPRIARTRTPLIGHSWRTQPRSDFGLDPPLRPIL